MSSVRILALQLQCHESLLDSAEAPGLRNSGCVAGKLSSPVSDQYWETLYREEKFAFQQVAAKPIAGEEQVIGLLECDPFYFSGRCTADRSAG